MRLWWLRKRRNFKKRDLAVAIYGLFVYLCVWAGFFIGATKDGATISLGDGPAFVGLIVVTFMTVADILMKAVMKRDTAAMDDYLKSRPVPEKAWNKFLVITNVLSIWSYLLPVMLLPFLFLLVTPVTAVACFVTMLLFSYADSLFVTCFRKTADSFLMFCLAAGWVVMFMAMLLFLPYTLCAPPVMGICGMILLAIAVIAGLAAFLANEDNYDESRHSATRRFSLGRVTLFSMQLYGLVRAKRLRNMMIIITVLFIFDAYFMALTGEESDASAVVYGVLAIILPPVVLSQWTFGVEANFFQGLMTKPVTVRQMLANNYSFYLLLSVACALLMVPMLFMGTAFTPLALVASLFISAFINLFNLPTCLFSSRLELFSSSFFNMQGANMKINFYSVALIIPTAAFVGVYLLWGPVAWGIASIATGVASLAVHRLVINKVAAMFEAKRYERMESFAS